MKFRISAFHQTQLLHHRERLPDGVINLSGSVDHIVRRVEQFKLDRYGYRSSTPVLIARLVEDSVLVAQAQSPECLTEKSATHQLEVQLAEAIINARLLKLTNAQDGYDSPRDAVEAAFPQVFLDALREQLRIVVYYIDESEPLASVADIDLSSCSVLTGAVATNVFAVDEEGAEIVFEEKQSPKISFREILDRIVEDKDANPYDDDDWRQWWDNNEPPFNDKQ